MFARSDYVDEARAGLLRDGFPADVVEAALAALASAFDDLAARQAPLEVIGLDAFVIAWEIAWYQLLPHSVH